MKTLFWGNLIFFAFFLVHLLVWKIRLPARQTKTLLILMFSGLAASVAAFILFPYLKLSGFEAPATPAEQLSVVLYVTAFILAYMITYGGVEADSPTLVMIKIIADAGENGIRAEDFFRLLNDDVLIKPRLRDLITDKMAVIEDGRYVLTSKGKLFAGIFIFYRGLLGLGKGG